MLSPEEFIVGTFANAKAGSLVLPRTKYETPALVCEGDGKPVAVLLDGDHAFISFPSGQADQWGGLIVPDVRIEIDESSLYDPDRNIPKIGTVVRREATLVVNTKAENNFGRVARVVIKSGLPDCGGSAAFTRWQVVLGRGDEKRVLHKINLGAS